MSISLRPLQANEREVAAELYWQAFMGKLERILFPEPKAIAFLQLAIQPAWSIAAVDEQNQILGVAGYKTTDGAFIQAGLKELSAIYGTIGALWRGPVLELFERNADRDQFVMDGICVAASARGQGIGTRLLAGIVDEAQSRGLSTVRLDVIDTNPRARALYERHQFVPTATNSSGFLAPIIGFGKYTTMVRQV